jgi:IS30 family transposase
MAKKRPVRRYWRLPDEVRREIIRRAAAGLLQRQCAEGLDVHQTTVSRILGPLGGVIRTEDWAPSHRRLSIEDRIEIRLALERGESFRSIARAIGRDPSTVCREINANGGRGGYRPMVAHRRARDLARRPKPTKLGCNRRLRDRVVADLERFWSPEQIARRLQEEFGDDSSMRISHETIYKSLYVQGRGELRRELARCLRSGRAKRRRRGQVGSRGRIPNIVLISERPAEVRDRAVPGHWEGDLLIGKDNKSAIGTLVERTTRYVMLLDLRRGYTASQVRDAMARTIRTLPESLRRSITWDQGKEMAEHLQFTVDTGVPVYFCDPHSPWQRGSNENTNGLLRQYFPKGTDLSVHAPKKLREVADSLNGRPRQTLDWMTPSEKLAEFLVAMTG